MSASLAQTYVAGHSAAVTSAHNMRTIDNSVPYLLPYLSALASQPFTLLDVGCGPGSISLDIARRFPSCFVIGVDGSPDVITQATAAAHEHGLASNTLFLAGDALDLQAVLKQASQKLQAKDGTAKWTLEAGFDIVHAHQVLQHVMDPFAVLKEMRGTARAEGGLVAVREADWGMFAYWPENRGLKRFHEVYMKTAEGRGCDPCVGRKMVGLALKAGFRRQNVEASEGPWVYSTEETRKWWVGTCLARWTDDGQVVARALAAGNLSGLEEAEEIRQGWREWERDEGGWYCMPCPQIVCRRE